jgi:hypothetical protein
MTIFEAIAELETSPKNIRFDRLKAICTAFFGEPRVKGSHHIFRMRWPGDPRINIQDRGGKVAEYQVKQAIAALQRLAEIERVREGN